MAQRGPGQEDAPRRAHLLRVEGRVRACPITLTLTLILTLTLTLTLTLRVPLPLTAALTAALTWA